MAEDAELIAEQLRHTIDLLRNEIDGMRQEQEHIKDMVDHRLIALETCKDDHEARIRDLRDGVTSFKVWSGLASGGSSMVALYALFKTWFGG